MIHLRALFWWSAFTFFVLITTSPVGTIDILPVSFSPESIHTVLDNTTEVNVTTDCSYFQNGLQVVTDMGSHVVTLEDTFLHNIGNGTICWGTFRCTGSVIGKAEVRVQSSSGALSKSLDVVVVRKKRVIDLVFIHCVAILVSIIYINFGCALDWDVLKKTIRRPIGPAIGFFSQFVVMPVISYGLGKLLFPDSPEMQLGLFFTGISPAGGASNMWTVALEGNVNLSIAMTTLSTICAFGMFPFWLFTLGHQIFQAGKIATPYGRILTYILSLVIPLSIGLLCQRFLPRFSKFMVRILKPFSLILIIFIIIFASVTHSYLFQLFTWRIAMAGIGLPWLGYLCGFLAAWGLRQPMPDVLAIAVETGVQNTGIAIFMLRFTLDDPSADLTTVIPVSVALMTPIPLLLLFSALKIRNRGQRTNRESPVENGRIYADSRTNSLINYTNVS